MIMPIEEYVKRKILPKEGDILIIQGILYQVVNSGQEIGGSDTCDPCSLNHKYINGKKCIYSFIDGVYHSCAELIEEPYIFKRVKKKFNGI